MYLLVSLIVFFVEPTYQATYSLKYHPDSTNLKREATERFKLMIKPNEVSYFASENYLKKDSINVLVKDGKLSVTDILGNPNYKFSTKFPQFIIKKYDQSEAIVHENIATFPYTFSVSNTLIWNITQEKDTLVGYVCTKATTNYAGRNYEAWFTTDIPITDGPYIFRGLPGLIIQLNDTRNHYVFKLESFGKYEGKIIEKPTYRTKKPIEITNKAAFELREEARKDILGVLTRLSGVNFDKLSVKVDNSPQYRPIQESMPDRSWDNNPLELK